MSTILVTGFGPFPGAPYNPTVRLVARLALYRRPALANVKIVPHIFPTSYVAVDRDLPKLIARHKPIALLMFGLATRARLLRIETRACNALARLPDFTGHARRGVIVAGGAPHSALAAPARRLLAAARGARVPVALSRDAGRYLCNYLCWRAAEAAAQKGGPHVTAFIHVPPVRRGLVPRGTAKNRHLTAADLVRAGRALLHVTVIAARR